MNFVLKDTYEVRAPVTIKTFKGDGRQISATVHVTYELIGDEEFDALMKSASGIPDNEILKRSVTNIDGVTDENGDPIPFDEEMFGKLLDITAVRNALTKKLLDLKDGKIRKN